MAFGYAPQEREIVVEDSEFQVVVVLQILPTQIPRVVVRGKQSGVVGTVVARAGFKPVFGATVEVLTTRVKTISDSSGAFELLKDMPPGRYVLFVKNAKFQSRMMAVIVPRDSAVEVLLLVDSLSAPGGNRLAGPLTEFNQRSHWMGARSALVPGVELQGHEKLSLADALRYAPSFVRKGLLLHEAITCLYIDGRPQPFMSAHDIPASNIEAVEVFGLRSDYTGTADLHWPSGVPCGNPSATKPRGYVGGGTAAMKSGLQAATVRSGRMRWDDYGRVVFVWLRHQ